MKGKKAHKREFYTPLCSQAVDVLRTLQQLTDHGPSSFVFAGGGKARCISGYTLRAVLKRLGYDATTHGFRSTLTDWAYEHGYEDVAVEAQLAHMIGTIARQRGERTGMSDKVRAAYLRSPFWDQRVKLLQAWGDEVEQREGGTLGDNVVPPRQSLERTCVAPGITNIY